MPLLAQLCVLDAGLPGTGSRTQAEVKDATAPRPPLPLPPPPRPPEQAQRKGCPTDSRLRLGGDQNQSTAGHLVIMDSYLLVSGFTGMMLNKSGSTKPNAIEDAVAFPRGWLENCDRTCYAAGHKEHKRMIILSASALLCKLVSVQASGKELHSSTSSSSHSRPEGSQTCQGAAGSSARYSCQFQGS